MTKPTNQKEINKKEKERRNATRGCTQGLQSIRRVRVRRPPRTRGDVPVQEILSLSQSYFLSSCLRQHRFVFLSHRILLYYYLSHFVSVFFASGTGPVLLVGRTNRMRFCQLRRDSGSYEHCLLLLLEKMSQSASRLQCFASEIISSFMLPSHDSPNLFSQYSQKASTPERQTNPHKTTR